MRVCVGGGEWGLYILIMQCMGHKNMVFRPRTRLPRPWKSRGKNCTHVKGMDGRNDGQTESDPIFPYATSLRRGT